MSMHPVYTELSILRVAEIRSDMRAEGISEEKIADKLWELNEIAMVEFWSDNREKY